MRDVFGVTYNDEDFAQLFEVSGRPANFAPWRLALVTAMRFAEGLSDQQTAEFRVSQSRIEDFLSIAVTDRGLMLLGASLIGAVAEWADVLWAGVVMGAAVLPLRWRYSPPDDRSGACSSRRSLSLENPLTKATTGALNPHFRSV